MDLRVRVDGYTDDVATGRPVFAHSVPEGGVRQDRRCREWPAGSDLENVGPLGSCVEAKERVLP